jgi:O-antigen ligase
MKLVLFNNIFRQLKSILLKIGINIQTYIFWTTLIFYGLSFFNINNKTIFLSLLLLGLVLYFKIKDFRFSLIYITLVSLPFLVGKTWEFLLIPANQLQSSDYPKGYFLTLTITPYYILTSLLFILILRDLLIKGKKMLIQIKRLTIEPVFLFLALFFVWQLVSSLLIVDVFRLSFSYSALSILNLFLLYAIGLYCKLNQKFFRKISVIFAAMVIFETTLALIQWLHRSTLGLAIETVDQYLTYFTGPAQGFFSIRSLGTFSHPNELALFSLGMSLFFLPYILYKNNHVNLIKIFKLAFIAAILSLVLSLGRSSWLTFVFCFLIFLFIVEKKWHQKLVNFSNFKTKTLIYYFIIITVFSTIIFPRLIKTVDLFKPGGGGEARIRLINETINLISLRPFFGTGIGLSGYYMFRLNPQGIISTFPTTVHNIYLKIASESGIPGLALFLIIIIYWFKKFIKNLKNLKNKDKVKMLGLSLAVMSYLINGIMQQIFLFGFFIIYLLLGTIKYEDK